MGDKKKNPDTLPADFQRWDAPAPAQSAPGSLPADFNFNTQTTADGRVVPISEAGIPTSNPTPFGKGDSFLTRGIVSGKDILNSVANNPLSPAGDMGSKIGMRLGQKLRGVDQSQASANEQAMFGPDRYKQLKDYSVSPPSKFDESHPIIGGLAKGAAGAATDTADVASSFTSPASIGLMAAGPLTRAIPLGLTTRAVQAGSGVVMGLQGIKGAVGAATDKALPSPDRLQQILFGAGATAGGLAGVFDAAPSPRTILDGARSVAPLALREITGRVPILSRFEQFRKPTFNEYGDALKPDPQLSLFRNTPKLGDSPIQPAPPAGPLQAAPVAAPGLQAAPYTPATPLPSYMDAPVPVQRTGPPKLQFDVTPPGLQPQPLNSSVAPLTTEELSLVDRANSNIQGAREWWNQRRIVDEMNRQEGEGQDALQAWMNRPGGGLRGKDSVGPPPTGDPTALRDQLFGRQPRSILNSPAPDTGDLTGQLQASIQDAYVKKAQAWADSANSTLPAGSRISRPEILQKAREMMQTDQAQRR